MTGGWFVFDPNPTDRDDYDPILVGPFADLAGAEAYANLIHPDDGDGNCVVLQAEPA